MIYRICVVILAACSFLIGQPRDFVRVQGVDLVDAQGDPVILRGINLGNWLVPEGYMFKFDSSTSPRKIEEVISELVGPDEARRFWEEYRDSYITHEDIRLIKRLGFNSVRVPFNWRLFVDPENTGSERPTGMKMLERVAGWCEAEELWVIFDMHCAPGGQTGDNIDDSWGYPFLFENRESQELTIQIWTAIARKFAGNRSVIGYDLLNEPIAHYFDAETLNPLLEPFYREAVAAIRAVDTNHVIFLGGAQWDTNFKPFGPPFDTKLVYTFHKYWTPATKNVLQEYIDFRSRHNVPVWMGESGENTTEWIAAFRSLLEEHRIGWCFWPYKKMNARSSPVTFPEPEEWGLIKQYANAHRSTYRAIRSARIDQAAAKKILREFLQNCRAEKCSVNEEYIRALGLQEQ